MRVIDPGHLYELHQLDSKPDTETKVTLRFVKREGSLYPGNVGHYAGTTIQDVCRVLIDRLKYVHHQIPCQENLEAMKSLREVIFRLEDRAAKRHKRKFYRSSDARPFDDRDIEHDPFCPQCGHIGCMDLYHNEEDTNG